ncbi:interleukin-17 receptor D [Eucyclogobius newberryi]|uniref:interleukin-17 receptor D n=1 Tax=Eucyclogobius newberryi TaxID=166745 RepID=UPI003B58BC5C
MASCSRLLRGVLLLCLCAHGNTTPGNKKNNNNNNSPDRCALKVSSGYDGPRKLPVTFKTDNCSLLYPGGKHVIHEVMDVSFSHLSCEDQAAVVVHWAPSPLGIEHIKGFRVYLEDKNPERKQCQHLILKEPRQLNYSYKSTRLSSQPFSGLSFDTDYMIRVVPFPSLMNESFFPPSFLRTNSCAVLLGAESLVCKPFWKPKSLNVSQSGSNLHVTFDPAPPTFHLSAYHLFYKLRQDGPFRSQRCKPDLNQARTTCVVRGVTPGTYTIELRDDDNATRRQTQFHVSQVHSPWAGPIRAMAITVPLVVMSAFATLFTVMCRKKQQENIYSHLDEESSESSNQSAALISERPWPRPKVFLCHSSRDGPKHSSVVQAFAYFLQDFCGCEVALDLWEHLDMCREGQMSWLSRQLDEADFIITVCSKGLRYFVERKSRRGKTPVGRRGNSGSSPAPKESRPIGGGGGGGDRPASKDGGPVGGDRGGGDLFLVAVAMISEQLRLAKQSEKELSRFMAVYFDYSTENDIPTALSLAPRLKLMDQLPQLFSRLHSSHPSLWDAAPPNVSRRNYFRSKSGRSLYVSICNMHQFISQSPDWFDQQLHPHAGSPAHHRGPPPAPCEAPAVVAQSSLVLNEVAAKTLDSAPNRKNLVVLAPGSGPGSATSSSLSPSYSPGYDPGRRGSQSLPSGSSRCSSSLSAPSSSSSAASSANVPCVKAPPSADHPRSFRDQDQAGDGEPSPPEPPPRDSGIYDSSVPSSELSIPLMDGLSHDHVDSSSLADSESSSSGLGDEEPPTVSSLRCSAPTVCKAELHRPDAPVMSL